MNILSDIYKRSLQENEKNRSFWEEYLQNLNSLDFSIYSDKLKVPILVPIGNRILFRGSIKHTNEVTVALGADYFTKCSIKQAEVLRQHRIKDAKIKLEEYNKEKEYLESQISFGKENLHADKCHDIIEVCSEEEDRIWREQHKERVRQYYQSKVKKPEIAKEELPDKELWLRLEELELQEELENELGNTETFDTDDSEENSYDSFIIKEDDMSNIQAEENEHEAHITHNIPKQTSKIDLLQQVIDRQRMLETKLNDMKNRQRVQSKTENDLLSRLDEIEQMDEVEDEMVRLDDILEGSEDAKEKLPIIKRGVSFADEDDSQTVEITFKHTNNKPSEELYNPDNGITKPSDIYDAYQNLFLNETTSILKKSKYNIDINVLNNNYIQEDVPPVAPAVGNIGNRTILIKDVQEKSEQSQSKVDSDKRPTSLFKLRRQQQKE